MIEKKTIKGLLNLLGVSSEKVVFHEKEILGISSNTKRINKDWVFFALPGTNSHGIEFVEEAVDRGASIIITDTKIDRKLNVPTVLVPSSREALRKAVSWFFDYPEEHLSAIGVTGTNGKTTTTYLIESILHSARRRSILIGTIEYRINKKRIMNGLTTPEPEILFGLMRKGADEGAEFLIMEVSSHSLQQDRTGDLLFDIAIFTNLTQDHLDYHKDMDDYLFAKLKIVEKLKPASTFLINLDDRYAPRFMDRCNKFGKRFLTYGTHPDADIRFAAKQKKSGLEVKIDLFDETLVVTTPMLGFFNAYNVVSAALCCHLLGIDKEKIVEGIELLQGVPGRMERIKTPRDILAVVDYSHTPDSLEKALLVLRSYTKKRLICVFGCGGDRDKKKRPMMGRIASKLADIVVITSDNPRTEDPDSIIDDIKSGISDSKYYTITNRKEAIKFACEIAEEGDTILVAGKGHEDYQIIGNKKVFFSDQKELLRWLKK